MSKRKSPQNIIDRQWQRLIQDLRSKTHFKIEKKTVEAKNEDRENLAWRNKYWQELTDYGSAFDYDPERSAILFEQYLYYQSPARFLSDGEKQELIRSVKDR